MTRALPFTKASIKRAIAAAEEAGYCVKGIRPDGTVIVDNGPSAVPLMPTEGQDKPASKWEDVQA